MSKSFKELHKMFSNSKSQVSNDETIKIKKHNKATDKTLKNKERRDEPIKNSNFYGFKREKTVIENKKSVSKKDKKDKKEKVHHVTEDEWRILLKSQTPDEYFAAGSNVPHKK